MTEGTKQESVFTALHETLPEQIVIVINKAPRLVCQLLNDKNLCRNNSFNKLTSEVKQKLELPDEPWPVHRLDKDTTGALLLARSHLQAREFQVQFKGRAIRKTYLALVQAGRDAFPGTSGEIRSTFVYGPDGRFDRLVPVESAVEQGKTVRGSGSVGDLKTTEKQLGAATDWKLLASSRRAPISLVSLNLKTGAKHQLRIHLSKVLNAPVLGDPLYSSDHHLSYIPGVGVQRGLYLHSSHVSFHSYRQTGNHKRFRIGVTAPLPPYFVQACQKLRLPLTDELINGGVRIDDVPQDLSFLRKGEGTDNVQVQPDEQEEADGKVNED